MEPRAVPPFRLGSTLTPPHDSLSRRSSSFRFVALPDLPLSSRPQWGCGEDGQLGLPSAPVTAKSASPDWHVPTPTALRLPAGESVAVSATETRRRKKPLIAGSRNSAALARSGALYTWGWNSHDTLGLDTDEEWIPEPRKAATTIRRCDETETETNNAQESDSAFASVSFGGWHAVALDRDGRAWAWGGNEYGQGGVRGDARDERHAGVHVSEHVSVPAPVAFAAELAARPIARVACGGMNSFALERDSFDEKDDAPPRVFEWGARAGSERAHARAPVAVPFPRLFPSERVTALAAGSFHVLALTSASRVFAWGKGDYGQLGLGRPGNWDAPRAVPSLGDKDVVSVHAGGWHSCALARSGVCFTWGRGEYGRLGMAGDQADKQAPARVAFEGDEREEKIVVDAALGGSHTCFLDARGAVWTVGRNNHGRLGRVVHGKWTGDPGRVVFPPPRGGGEWVCESVVAGGRHTLAVARAAP